MFQKFSVLHISYDKLLLDTRTAILQQAGYMVTSAGSFAQAIAELRERRFDVVLIGHSLPTMDSGFFMRLARRKGSGVMALLLRHGEIGNPEADVLVDASDGPTMLLEHLHAALDGAEACRNRNVSRQILLPRLSLLN